MIKRGDTISFLYTPSKFSSDNPKQVWARTKVKRVYKQNGTVLVNVWNGQTLCAVKDQYENIEIPITSI